MTGEYIPPDPMPFNFTSSGYEPPNSKELLFNFAGRLKDLQAAINVTQPYWHETHTYPKTCPKYVVGYGSGSVQIIKGRCTFGGIRDLRAYCTPIPPVDLPAIIYVTPREHLDLPTNVHGWQEGDLAAYLDVISINNLPADIHGWQESNLGSRFTGTHDPEDLGGYVDVYQRHT